MLSYSREKNKSIFQRIKIRGSLISLWIKNKRIKILGSLISLWIKNKKNKDSGIFK